MAYKVHTYDLICSIINSLAENKSPAGYVDESCLQENYILWNYWHSSGEKGVLKKDGVGYRWILCNGAGDMGFIDGALLVFK